MISNHMYLDDWFVSRHGLFTNSGLQLIKPIKPI